MMPNTFPYTGSTPNSRRSVARPAAQLRSMEIDIHQSFTADNAHLNPDPPLQRAANDYIADKIGTCQRNLLSASDPLIQHDAMDRVQEGWLARRRVSPFQTTCIGAMLPDVENDPFWRMPTVQTEHCSEKAILVKTTVTHSTQRTSRL